MIIIYFFLLYFERLTLAWHHPHQTSSSVLLVAPLCIASLVTTGSAASGGFSVFGEWVCWAAQWKECLLSVGGAFCCLNAGGQRWKLQVLYFIVASFWSRNLKSLRIVSRKKKKVLFSFNINVCEFKVLKTILKHQVVWNFKAFKVKWNLKVYYLKESTDIKYIYIWKNKNQYSEVI